MTFGGSILELFLFVTRRRELKKKGNYRKRGVPHFELFQEVDITCSDLPEF